jgi:hypothetical protein
LEVKKEADKGLCVDFSDQVEDNFLHAVSDELDNVKVKLPLPSFGVSNSHIDLCSDLLDVSWSLEHLAGHAKSVQIEIEEGYFKPNVIANFSNLDVSFYDALNNCALLFGKSSERPVADADRIRNEVDEYEDKIGNAIARVPEIVDWYLVNLVLGANSEWKYENPSFYRHQMSLFPERQVRFFRSAYSSFLGAACYASSDSWLVPRTIELDKFMEVTGQRYRSSNFIRGGYHGLRDKHLIISEEMIVRFPMKQFLRSQACAGILAAERDDHGEIGIFDWLDFPLEPYPIAREDIQFDVNEAEGRACLVESNGAAVVVVGDDYYHVMYDVAPLYSHELKSLLGIAQNAVQKVSSRLGLDRDLFCDWATLSDEDFEQICYDLIYLNPRFNAETIQKLGKSRSRDGGRDIQVQEVLRRPWEKSRKWIFQCKLVKDRGSLGATRLTDVGDMLDQYGAQGFGVLTSAYIDATLYDKLDIICSKRKVEQFHMSLLELERALSQNSALRKRYFGTIRSGNDAT